MEILTKENLVGAKIARTADFHSLSKENQVSLVRTFRSEPGSGSKISRLAGQGWKRDLDKMGHDYVKQFVSIFN